MLSVIIPTQNNELALARCLAALVPGAVDGVVAEVIVADRCSSDGTAQVADAAGCRIVSQDTPRQARVEAALAVVERGTWVLVLEPTVALEPGWQREVGSFIDGTERAGRSEEQRAVFRFAFDEFARPKRISQAVVAVRGHLLGMPVPEQGLLAHRTAAHRLLAREGGGMALIGALLGWRKLSVLRSRALVQPQHS
ncbi:glycosyltransferase [Amorphus sp. 3PC139-8]|uniref:glycosyltransferase n=1 Tax=Amorphus sp. 3PC139-8 TaxID=2735676 RepID=UPI00345D6D10